MISATPQTLGVVRHVDTINRELHVQIGDSIVTFDVPPDCTILLRGERVKLRMLQPLDRVRVTCTDGRHLFTAHVIEVQPG
jgi:hypothetical protein